MNSLELIQGSDEWRRARAGSLGASQIADMMARTKSGYGASRANLMAQLLVERLTGTPTESYVNAAMQHGINTEPQARLAYAFQTDCEVKQVGLVQHPTIAGSHASPDGLIGDDGLIEIKCPQSAQHTATLLGEPIAQRYIYQAMWQMACTGREWCDFVSFDPRLPPRMSMFVKRVPRDGAMIPQLERDVREFLAELDEKLASLKSLYG